eukprot:gene9033-12179_t
MASERGLPIKGNDNNRGWENSNFPILCEGCLGENPYVRMMVDNFGGTCKMCSRPFTVFKWRPGRGEGYKKTEVCQTCSKTKNLCQTCILDLQLALPSQLRDAVLSYTEGAITSESDVQKEYIAQQQLALINSGNNPWLTGESPNDRLIKLARESIYNREQPRLKGITLPVQQTIGTKRQVGEMYGKDDINKPMNISEESYIPDIPAGISLSNINPDRLPAAFKQFFAANVGIIDKIENDFIPSSNSDKLIEAGSTYTNEINDKNSIENKVNYNQINSQSEKPLQKKLVPRPPPGPPPPSAFVKERS